MTEIMGQSCFELITVKFVKKRQPFELITVTKWSPEYVLGNLFWKLCACQSAALHWVTAAKVSFKLSSNFPLSDAWVFHPLCYWVPCQGLERFPKITPPIPKMFEDFKGWRKKVKISGTNTRRTASNASFIPEHRLLWYNSYHPTTWISA